MKVLFFGTPLFAANVLEYLLAHGIDVIAVITKPDRPQGRSAALIPTPVKVIAQKHNLSYYQPEIVSDPEFAAILEQYQADLFAVVAYGEIIKQHVLDMPKVACINLHASLLPKYRGAAPIQHSIINGEKESGNTVIHLVKKMDAGEMIAVSKVAIGPNTTYGELEQMLCDDGSALLLKTIRDFEHEPPQSTPQNEKLVTYAPKIELEDCEIDWNQPAKTIHNLVRGINPHPGAWCMVTVKDQPKRLRIIKTRLGPVSAVSNNEPGNIMSVSKEGILIGCGVDSLYIVQLQLEGKKAMPAEEFMRGLPPGALKLHFKNA